ncbi:dnaJ homolog subfamily C member 28 [Alligator sinensis]|uniref:DnaJ homolog subfamily C member 28 n=1 Tax=Alligator sinensis TaxID=38654 RepID=A0A1U7SBK0_ALLSI|nr:dnaJ homolog subfamily C member 28 [Alligator sinensis]XP_006032714.1 dnaJ homolog subfamily C member 28 [Alligator sinensis]XP_006032715.1 dnaJ homolog subfamily C member 28 [Alligator sinensis]XP_006032716.1 dnaJ homolog subfamily C member 28 [Alligator sinensis]XP_006032717.1 dnaJ homolog subfamily C member 28 [Alligator sinensis]XP_025070185.1 dnaJ homolog subfamily C member 28 [Alligator sinensis]XP_025070186.1 dnaJ homolog subfamily C member 28 [Alligator sinensis]XP_025070187.1 dna
MEWVGVTLIKKVGCHVWTHRLMIPPKMRTFPCSDNYRMLSSYKPKNIKDSYRILKLQEGCSIDDIRNPFRNLAKQYHPDSGSVTADSATFMQIEEAYRTVLTDLSKKLKSREDEEEEEEDKFKSKTPQHRHYLSFEGVGFGTPSQRERQYMQFRVDRAADRVLEYRKQKLESQYTTNDIMIAKDVRQSKKVKITQAIERLVEDLIQESMAKGDFDNLSGKGKPLQKFSDYLHIDPMTHNLNRILIDNGYQPEWILLQKEIRETIEQLRRGILASRKKLGEPMTLCRQKQWDHICEQFIEDIKKLNKRINDFNLIVPILSRQMVHFSADKEIARAQKTYRTLMEEMRTSDKDPKENEQENVKLFRFKTTFFKLINLMLR